MSVRIVCGANARSHPVAGKSIGQIRKALKDILNLSPSFVAWLNGIKSDDATRLKNGDNLEFGPLEGVKGGVQEFWTESEIAELLGESAILEMKRLAIEPNQEMVFSKSQVVTLLEHGGKSQVISPKFRKPVVVDFSTMTLKVAEGEFPISDLVRYRLLACLAKHPNVYLPSNTLKREVWDDVHGDTADATVSREVRRLAKSLDALGVTSIWLDSKMYRYAVRTS